MCLLIPKTIFKINQNDLLCSITWTLIRKSNEFYTKLCWRWKGVKSTWNNWNGFIEYSSFCGTPLQHAAIYLLNLCVNLNVVDMMLHCKIHCKYTLSSLSYQNQKVYMKYHHSSCSHFLIKHFCAISWILYT